MRHHFGDSLDRDGGYWTTIPNRERYAYSIENVPIGSKEVTIITLGKDDGNWSRALTFPNLEELTLHSPSKEQLEAIGEFRSIRRLRITHARPQTIESIRSLEFLEELVLEYVSGFEDLSPVQGLKRLRAIHLENLRRVSDFGGLSGLGGLRYLSIHGTFDWKQPIGRFEFLDGLPNLEVLGLWQVINHSPYPALLPATRLKKLIKLRIPGCYLSVEEYALLEEGLPGVEGAKWGPYQIMADKRLELSPSDIRSHLPVETLREKYPEVMVNFDGKRTVEDPDSRWVEFTGKGEKRIKFGAPKTEAKCREAAERYDSLKRMARERINQALSP